MSKQNLNNTDIYTTKIHNYPLKYQGTNWIKLLLAVDQNQEQDNHNVRVININMQNMEIELHMTHSDQYHDTKKIGKKSIP